MLSLTAHRLCTFTRTQLCTSRSTPTDLREDVIALADDLSAFLNAGQNRLPL